MRREEFLEIVASDGKLSESEVKYGLRLFTRDAENKADYIAQFSHFNKCVLDAFYHKYYHDLHLIALLYIKNFEARPNPNPMLLGYLYINEAEYFMSFDVYTEALRNVNKALDMEKNLPGFYVSVALEYSIAIIEMSGNHDYLASIVEKMEKVIKRDDFVEYYRFHLGLNLMEAYAMLGNKGRSDYYYNFCTHFSDESIGEAERNLVEMTRISSLAAFFPNKKPSADYISRVRKCLRKVKKGDGIKADYHKYFSNVIAYVRGYIPDEEIIGYLKKCIDASYLLKDRIQLYQILISDFGISKESDPELYNGYCADLQSHFEMINNMQKYEVLGELVAREQMEKYRVSAETDALTGLGNRRAYDIRIEEILKLGKIQDSLCLIAMDLNGLKIVNDNFGHEAGDEFIIAAANCMISAFSKYGDVFRVGGDEFIAILTADSADIDKAMKKLSADANKWSKAHDRSLSVSIGRAYASDTTGKQKQPDVILARMTELADERMYEDKKEYYRKKGTDRRRN